VSDEKKDDKQNELEMLYPGVDVPVMLRGKGKETIRVEPFYAIQFTKAIAKMKPVAKAISKVASVEKSANGEQSIRLRFDGNFGAFLEVVIGSAEDGMTALIDLLSLALRKPNEWFDDVSLDGLFDLATAVFEQNRSFFERRLLPLLGAWLPGANKAGEQSTPVSSEPAIPETASTE
jgi:hypothetical protein